MFSKLKAGSTRGYNRRVFMEVIRQHGPISRAELSRLTGLTLTSASKITNELVKEGIVSIKGRRKGERGQPAVDMVLNGDGGHSVGLHWDRGCLSAVLINLNGDVKFKKKRTLRYPSPKVAMAFLVNFIQEALEKTGLKEEELWGVGIAFPGPFRSLDRTYAFPPNFPNLEGFPIHEKFSELIRVPVIIEHDVTAAAIGEQFHSSKPFDTFFYIYLGFGLGGGMILNGRPQRGAFGNASAISMVGYHPEQKNYCGDTATLFYLYQRLEADGITSFTSATLLSLFQESHPTLMDWLDQCVQYLSHGVVAVDALIDPEAIFLGGPLPNKIIEHLAREIILQVEQIKYGNEPLHRCKLLQATSGELAAAVGAATLPIYETMSPQAEQILGQ